jgi:hypothetical protein
MVLWVSQKRQKSQKCKLNMYGKGLDMYYGVISHVLVVNNLCNIKIYVYVLKWFNVHMCVEQMCYGQCYFTTKL